MFLRVDAWCDDVTVTFRRSTRTTKRRDGTASTARRDAEGAIARSRATTTCAMVRSTPTRASVVEAVPSTIARAVSGKVWISRHPSSTPSTRASEGNAIARRRSSARICLRSSSADDGRSGRWGARASAVMESERAETPRQRRDKDETTTSTRRLKEIRSKGIMEQARGTCGTSQARANATNILLGVGTLSVPYALREAGWSGLVVLAVLGVVTNYTGKILIECQRRGSLPVNERSMEARGGRGAAELTMNTGVCGDEQCADEDESWGRDYEGIDGDLVDAIDYGTRRPLLSYEDIGEAAFGKRGRAFITGVLYTELVGTAGLFFILEGDHLAKLLHMPGQEEMLACMAAAVMIPTTWLLDLSSLSYVGALGLLASTSVTGVISFEFFRQVVASGGALPQAATDHTAFVHASTFPVSFGLLAFVFAGHAVFPSIYSSMEQPEEYEEMLDASYGIVALNCLALGVAGYCLFGDAVADQVTLSLPAGSLATLAFALTTVNPFAKFALTLDPVAKGAESLFDLRVRASSTDAFVSRLLRTGLGVTALYLAIKLPFFGAGMSLIGCVLTLVVSVLFPSLCYLRMFGDDLDESEKYLNYTILVVGVVCALSGTAGALETVVDDVAALNL